MTGRAEPERDPRALTGVAAYLFRQNERGFEVLLLRRTSSRYFGEWFPVEGRVEPGESEEETARREVHEETSIEPVAFQRMQAEPVRGPGNVAIHVFVSFVAPDVVVALNEEHSEYEWVDPEEAVRRLPVVQQRKALRQIMSRFLSA